MKKIFVLAISLAMIFCATLAIVPASAATVTTTSDVVLDTNVFKGDYVAGDGKDIDSVIVWVDVKESKFNEALEYGTFIYTSCKEENIVLEQGAFNPAESGKSTFATRFDVASLTKGVEYAVKGYVKDGDSVKLSKNTAYFNVNDNEERKFDLTVQGGNITYPDQESASDYGANQINTQYFVYRDGVLLGATNELKFNVIDDLFVDGVIEEDVHEVTIKTVSGLNNGGQSNAFEFEVQEIADEASFLENVGTDEDNIKPKNVYHVLTADLYFGEGTTYKTRTIVDSRWDLNDELQCIVRYFADTLDGRGHSIKIDYDCATQSQEGNPWFAGLFGRFCETGFVRNLRFDVNATYDYLQTSEGGERATAFAMVGRGSYENCVMTAKLKSLNNGSIRRDAIVGFPGDYTATNVIAKIELLNSSNESIGEVKCHDNADAHYGTRFHWEGIHTPESNEFIMVSPIKMGLNYSIGAVKGKNVTYYNSFDDVLTGTEGINLDQEGMSSIYKGDIREDVV